MKLHLTPYHILTTWPSSAKEKARGTARQRIRSQKPVWELLEPDVAWPIMAPAASNHLVMIWGC